MSTTLAASAISSTIASAQALQRLLCALGLTAFAAGDVSASHLDIAGQWTCTVRAQSDDPDSNYGLELAVRIQQNNTLYARGVVIYPNLVNNIQKVEGQGDWTASPAEGNKGEVIKFRMQPQNHPIITWFAAPAGKGRMYNFFSFTSDTGAASSVETQCSRSR